MFLVVQEGGARRNHKYPLPTRVFRPRSLLPTKTWTKLWAIAQLKLIPRIPITILNKVGWKISDGLKRENRSWSQPNSHSTMLSTVPIHSKSLRILLFNLKNLRKKCVNRNDDKSAYINQKSKKCIIWTLNFKAHQEVCLLWLHVMQDISTHFGLWRCLFTFTSNILQNWYFSRSQTIFLRKIPNCLQILESSESSF